MNRPYLMRFASQQVSAAVTAVLDGDVLRGAARRVEIETQRVVALDHQDPAFRLVEFGSDAVVAEGAIQGPASGGAVPEAARRGLTVWFTGLSGAGKTTISQGVRERLVAGGHRVEVLDGDAIRTTLSKGLGFSREDRDENIHRIGFLARLLVREGTIALVAAVSPYRATRDEVRNDIGAFVEVFVNAPLAVCEQRDVKGLYQKAREGKIRGFTGIDDPYEQPLDPDVECRTDLESVEESVERVMRRIAGAIGE